MINRQMELGLENRPVCHSAVRRRRPGRAYWWFQRMRGVVEEARDWEPAVLPREGVATSATQAEPLESGIAPRASKAGMPESAEPRSPQGPARWGFVRIRGVEGE